MTQNPEAIQEEMGGKKANKSQKALYAENKQQNIILKKSKKQLTNWEKIFAAYTTDKGRISLI